MPQDTSAAPPDESDFADLIQIDLNVSIQYNAGAVSPEWLKRQLESSFERAVGEGALTGSSEAEVDVYIADVVALSRSGASLTEENLATFLQDLLESGNLKPSDVGRTMARYALSSSASMREELAERMGLDGDELADGADTPSTPKG